MTDDPARATDKQPQGYRGRWPQWKPGQSGNPAGRPPKGEALSELLEQYHELPVSTLRALVEDESLPAKVHTVIRQILDGLSTAATATQARAYTFDRVLGRPKQAIDQTVEERRVVETITSMPPIVLLPEREGDETG